MEKASQRFLIFCQYVVYILFGAISLYLFLLSMYSTCMIFFRLEGTYWLKDFPLLMLAGLLGLTGILTLFRYRLRMRTVRLKAVLGILTLIWLAVMAIFILSTDIRPVYDQARVYEGVFDLLNGDYSMWEKGGYFYMYPFQSGIVLLYAPFALLFGGGTYLAVQFFNLLALLLAFLGLSLIAGKYFSKKTAVFTYAALLLFLPIWGYVKYMYGTIPGLCMAVWALYLEIQFEEKGRWRYLAGSGGCLFLALMWKNNFIIYGIAMLIMLLLASLRKHSLKLLVGAGVLAGVMIAEAKGIPLFMHFVTGEVTNQGIPFITWIAMGLRESYTAPGWYDGDSTLLFKAQGYDVQLAKAEALEGIKSSFEVFAREKDYCLRFFSRKMASIWNNPTFEGFAVVVKGNVDAGLSYEMKDILYNGGIVNTILCLLMDVMQSVHLFGVMLYLIFMRKKKDIEKALPFIIFIGGFLFHLAWEGKCQYTLPYYILLIPYAVCGYEFITRRLLDYREKEGAILLSKGEKTTGGGNLNGGLRKRTGGRSLNGCLLKRTGGGSLNGCLLKRTGGGRWLLGLCILVVTLSFLQTTFLSSTIKLQGDEGAYIWLCTHEAEWKEEDYRPE